MNELSVNSLKSIRKACRGRVNKSLFKQIDILTKELEAESDSVKRNGKGVKVEKYKNNKVLYSFSVVYSGSYPGCAW